MAELTGKRFLDKLDTPCLILPTHIGQLPYSPVDMDTRIQEPVAGIVDIGDVHKKDFGATALDKLCQQSDQITRIMSPRGHNGPIANANNNGIFVDTNTGRKSVTIEEYAQRIAIDRPAAVIALADEVAPTETQKRLRKAMERTKLWHPMLAKKLPAGTPLIGFCIVDQLDSIPNVVVELLRCPVAGIVAGGLYASASTSASDRSAYLRALHTAVAGRVPILTLHSSCSKLEPSPYAVRSSDDSKAPKLNFKRQQHQQQQQQPKPKPDPVVQTFSDILEDIEVGVDVVSTVYPLQLATAGRAFVLSPPVELQAPRSAGRQLYGCTTEVEEVGKKRGRSAEEQDDNVKRARVSQESFTMDLWHPAFERDARPLEAGCGCIACQRHTRAYVHHLLKSNELLAEILLYQHNQWRLLDAFGTIRKEIQSGTFAQWKQSVCDEWQPSPRAREDEKQT